MSQSPNENASEGPKLSQAEREKFQQLFAHGNRQMSIASFDYANEMFVQCVLGDPGNVIYFKTFLANLKKKYGDKKKKGVFSFLSGTAKKATASKNPEQVFKAGITAIQSNPWDVSALLSIGGACEELGYHDVAVEYYRAAVDAEPFDVEANRVCAAALRELADFDGALVCVMRILKTKPGDYEAEKLRKDITIEKTIHKGNYAKGDSSQVRDAAAQMKGGVAEDEDVMGRPLTYIEQVEKRIKKNPDDIANFIELAQYFYQQGDYVQSEKYYVEAVRLSKNEPDMIERLLDTQKQKLSTRVSGLEEDVVQLKEKALDLKKQFEAHKTAQVRDEFYKIKEEYENAKKELPQTKEELGSKNLELARHRIKYHPNHAGYHFEYGMLLKEKDEIKEAIAEFQSAKADTMRKGECMLALGECFEKINQNKLAMTHYQEAVEAIPDNVEEKKVALYQAARLAYQLEDYAHAEEYGLRLAAIDFSYKDLGALLDKVAQKRQN